ncbi:MAG TPA: tetratricopeptide repeat protein [Kofleriaceae bacterium]|nr:tetratricopeptide repeat protein [Kofleriaceae bacterium]
MLRRPLVVVLAVALLVRVLYVLSIRHAVFFDHLQTEPLHYDEWARAILDGRAPVHLPFDEAPGYPYFVALIYAVTGRSVLALCLVQAALGAGACAAIAAIAGRLGGPIARWTAGLLAALYAPLIYFTGQLEPAALAVTATAAALLATPTAPASRRRWFLAGATWALAIVIRSELALAVPLVALHAWRVASRRAALHVAIVPAALVALSLAANIAASGHPVLLTTGSGVNLWLGNNPAADGVDPFIHGPLVAVVQEVEASSPDPVERDRAFARHARLSAPLLAKKLVWTFSRRELPNAADISWQTSQSWVFQPPVFPIGFAVLLPLAAAGLVAAGRARDRIALAGPVLAGLVACVVFFTNARFRLVMAPSLSVLAGLAIEAFLRGERRRKILAAAGFVAGAAVAWPSYAGVSRYRIAEIDFNTASLEHLAGHLDRAALYLRSGLARQPDDPAAWRELAQVLEQSGDHVGARAAMNRLLELPGSANR